MKWALLDFEGKVIRLYNFPAKGTIEIKEPKLTYDELLIEVGECLI